MMNNGKSKKMIPDIRFAGFTDDWEQRKLGEVADIVRGASPRPIKDKKWFDQNSEIGWLRISDVTAQNGRIHHLEQRLSALGQKKTRVLTEPHLLLSIAATVGKPVVNYVKTGVHDGFLIFQNPRFDREFMFQWLEMFRPYWNRYGQPGSQVNLNSDLVNNQNVSLPVPEEQRVISDLLSKMDKTITLHQRKLSSLESLKTLLLQSLFPKNNAVNPAIRFSGFTNDWEQRKLREILKVQKTKEYIVDSEASGQYDVLQQGDNPVAGYSDKNPYTSYSNVVLFGDHTVSLYKPEHPFLLATDGVKVLSALDFTSKFLYTFLEKNKPEPQGYKRHFSILKEVSGSYPVDKEESEKIGNLFDALNKTITLHQR